MKMWAWNQHPMNCQCGKEHSSSGMVYEEIEIPDLNENDTITMNRACPISCYKDAIEAPGLRDKVADLERQLEATKLKLMNGKSIKRRLRKP